MTKVANYPNDSDIYSSFFIEKKLYSVHTARASWKKHKVLWTRHAIEITFDDFHLIIAQPNELALNSGEHCPSPLSDYLGSSR